MFKDAIQPSLEEKGYKVTIKELAIMFSLIKHLQIKKLILTCFSILCTLKKFATGNNLKLTAIAEIPTAGMGIYSNKVKSLDELKEGALVTIQMILQI